MKIRITLAILVIAICSQFQSNAQDNNTSLDKIAAIVGDKIILKSDIEASFEDYKRETPNIDDSVKCQIMESLLAQKILVEQADRDSVIVGDEEVEGALDNRIRYFLQQYGSEEKLQEIAGKSSYQLKDDYRPIFKDQLTAQRMQQQIMSTVKITPQEVKAFYDKIPVDSLPYYPSMVEVGQIVFRPNINKEVEDYARNTLEDIRKDIIGGRVSFEEMAGRKSDDPGSKDNGGDLGIMGRDELVPEFAAAAFKLQNGEISPVVKTKFGFHIVQMVNRQGEKAKLRHILIKPLITSDMVKETLVKADSVRADLVSGKMVFSSAVGKYTQDDVTKVTGGMFTNAQTSSSLIQIEELEPAVALLINELKIGTFSQPLEFVDAKTGDKLVRIIYLKNRTEPHKANLKEDYNRIQEVAFAEKQTKTLSKWIEEKIGSFYIMIDSEYKNCNNISKWVTANTSAHKH